MKKLFLFFAVFFLAVSAYAIDLKTGSFAALAGQERVRVDFDFSDVMIDGMTLENFLELGVVDDDFKDWNDFVNFIKRRFLAGINSDTYKFVEGMVFFTGESETDFSIRVSPAMMNIDGKYIINYSLVDNATGEVLGTAYQTGDGGTFGSFSNLQGDGFEEAAEAFKKFLNKQLKPEK